MRSCFGSVGSVAWGLSRMRVLSFLCFSCAAATYADLGGVEGQSDKFLASLSRRGAASSSDDVVGTDYARETQSPMVWLNLHKSNLNSKFSSPSLAYEDYASQRLGEPHLD